MIINSCVLSKKTENNNDVNKNIEPTKLEDIAYDVNESYGYTVYLKENDEYVPYLVLTNNYNGNCLLLRKYLLDEPMRYNSTAYRKNNYYATCEIDTYLNSSFLSLFSENMQKNIEDTNIEIISWRSIGLGGSKTEFIKRKVFLLSLKETAHHAYRLEEGKKLEYFNIDEKKKRLEAKTQDEIIHNWFLRTPESNTRDMICYIEIGGVCRSAGILTIAGYTSYYVRPALCIKRDCPIQLLETDDNSIYIIE